MTLNHKIRENELELNLSQCPTFAEPLLDHFHRSICAHLKYQLVLGCTKAHMVRTMGKFITAVQRSSSRSDSRHDYVYPVFLQWKTDQHSVD